MNEETKAEINLYNITFSGLPLECPSLAYVFPFVFLSLSLFLPQNHFAVTDGCFSDKERHPHNTAVLLKDKKQPTFLGIRLH